MNPMPTLWAGITQSIENLEMRHASSIEWTRLAESCDPITSLAELDATLRLAGISIEDRETVRSEWGKTSPVVHYGFESDHHALVFFADDHASKVFKW
jgi:hypothetical protein